MDDKSGDDDTGEVRWSWRRNESGRGRWRSLEYICRHCDTTRCQLVDEFLFYSCHYFTRWWVHSKASYEHVTSSLQFS